ncbi:unnamed protein product [Linum tenue]|uniref:BED-type domain-containing protein n=1 Tax=Linum tenue TaxID=586396 RepID=A0AAV0K9X5_9ROSI|nr:unnamed protein product [Linum tenue]
MRVDGKPKAECKYCKKRLVGDPSKGTTHLKNHYHRCPKVKRPGDIKQQLLQGNLNKEKFQLTLFNFSQENSRKGLAHAIIKHEYPLSIVEHEGFKSYSMSLNPLICGHEKQDAMELLRKNEGLMAITTDMWTSSQKNGFMAVTTLYIDKNWTL